MNRQDIKEKAIFLGFTTGVFLPIRVVFYSLVSTWWLGSFGVITAVMILMLYLVHKGKLGYVGRIWKKQIIKISKGKLGVTIIFFKIMSIVLLAMIVWATDMNRGTTGTAMIEQAMRDDGIEGMGEFIAYTPVSVLKLTDSTLDDWIMAGRILYHNPQIFGQMYAVIDMWTYGYHQHFNMVWLVEACESLGLVLYFRYYYQRGVIIK